MFTYVKTNWCDRKIQLLYLFQMFKPFYFYSIFSNFCIKLFSLLQNRFSPISPLSTRKYGKNSALVSLPCFHVKGFIQKHYLGIVNTSVEKTYTIPVQQILIVLPYSSLSSVFIFSMLGR